MVPSNEDASFSERKMSESPDRLPPPAVEIFLGTKDLLCAIFVDKYVEDVGTLFSLARLTRRTMELLYGHPDLVLARKVHETFVHQRHRVPVKRLDPKTIVDSNTILECDHCPRSNSPYRRCYCQCHEPCQHCVQKVIAILNPRSVEATSISPKQCEMYQRHLNAMYVHGNVRLALYYREFAKRSMVRTLDIRIDKLLSRGHVEILRWLIDGNGVQRPLPVLSLGEPQTVDLTTFLFHTLRRNYDKFPDKNILATLDVAISYLKVIKVPLTDDSVRNSIRILRTWDGMTLEGMQALFRCIPSMKSTLEPKTYENVQGSVLFADLVHIFAKEFSNRKVAEETLKIIVFLLHHCPDREKRLATYLNSIIVHGARPTVPYNLQLVSSGKGLAKVLTRLFEAISDGFPNRDGGVGYFCWAVFFASPEFEELNKRVIYPVSIENINKQYFNRMLASGLQRATHMTSLRIDEEGAAFPELLSKSLRHEKVLSKYMTFVTHKFIDLLSIPAVPLDPRNRVPLDDDEGEPVQKRSRQ